MRLLIKLFVNDYKNINDIKVVGGYGKVANIFGIVLNVCLFTIKFLVGTIFGSVAITADAFNNLSDAGSSIVALISIIFSAKPADKEHPYGHERVEYVGSLIIAFIIMFFGLTLIKESVDKIINPEILQFDVLMVVVLAISILVKGYMFYYNRHYGKIINSSVMKATATDSISDVMATSVVLISIIISKYFDIQLDGYIGVAVALFIMKSGFDIIKGTLDQLLGTAPNEELIQKTIAKIISYDGVLGVHDLIVHSYGPRRTFISAHVEVDCKENVLKSHDMIDNIERTFMSEYNICLVIHMDPVETADEFTKDMRVKTSMMIKTIDSSLSIHDFRVVKGKTHNNLIFDVVLPYTCKLSKAELIKIINERLPQSDIPNYAVVTIDNAYSIQPED